MGRLADHGMSNTPTYRSWRSMKSRCTLPCVGNYAEYGGRGIAFAPDWADFNNFLRDMGVRPLGTTLDRKDNDGNYSKDNCRWATLSEQQRNKRSFTQPPGKIYGEECCVDCEDGFVKMSPRAKRCPPCLAHSRRYHRGT